MHAKCMFNDGQVRRTNTLPNILRNILSFPGNTWEGIIPLGKTVELSRTGVIAGQVKRFYEHMGFRSMSPTETSKVIDIILHQYYSPG